MCPPAAFAEHWKGAAAPWRVVHNFALMLLLLTSRRFAAFSALDTMQPLKACGRFSLQVFSTGCILALLGRIVFADVGVTPAVQLAVNFGGIAVQLLLASILARRTFDRRAMPRFMTPAIPPRMST
ncbi:MAG: OpgC domain-containing protein [Caulobacteraceae bacterium]|nr:OpgC domain-containing protein [Caulobacter sp.]